MTKIIVTLGPSSINKSTLLKLKEAGANAYRINLSHSNENMLESYIHKLNEVDIVPAIDTQGPQLRIIETNILKKLKIGEPVFVGFQTCDFDNDQLINPTIILNHIEALNQIEVGDIIRMDFSGLAAKIIKKDHNNFLHCEVISTGLILKNRAVDILGKTLKLSVLTDFDKLALKISESKGCKEVYSSFISTAKDVKEVRNFISDKSIKLISKIETSLGITNVSEIAKLSDAILIDRGDLSREISIPLVPIATSKIIELCHEIKKPVYVATNVLDSMMSSNIPSRAEVSDIFNLLNKGVSGIVLAAEVAIGDNPVKSVALLKHLIKIYENNKKGLLGFSKIELPSKDLIGAELLNWI